MSDKRLAVMTLKLIAAKAEKLAFDIEMGRLWGGDLSRGIGEIQTQLNDVMQTARDDR